MLSKKQEIVPSYIEMLLNNQFCSQYYLSPGIKTGLADK